MVLMVALLWKCWSYVVSVAAVGLMIWCQWCCGSTDAVVMVVPWWICGNVGTVRMLCAVAVVRQFLW